MDSVCTAIGIYIAMYNVIGEDIFDLVPNGRASALRVYSLTHDCNQYLIKIGFRLGRKRLAPHVRAFDLLPDFRI